MKEHDFKKRETVGEDMVGLLMTTSQSVHEPTLTRTWASTQEWKERSEVAIMALSLSVSLFLSLHVVFFILWPYLRCQLEIMRSYSNLQNIELLLNGIANTANATCCTWTLQSYLQYNLFQFCHGPWPQPQTPVWLIM